MTSSCLGSKIQTRAASWNLDSFLQAVKVSKRNFEIFDGYRCNFPIKLSMNPTNLNLSECTFVDKNTKTIGRVVSALR